MPTELSLQQIINHNIFARGTVKGYSLPSETSTVKRTYSDGQLIGSIYSAVVRDGNPWYMVYDSAADYANMQPTWIKHDIDKISLPSLPDILQQIQEQKDQEDIDKNGMLGHLLKKYAPWIVGGVVVAVAAPTLLNAGRKNVSGMTSDQKNLTGIGIAAIAVYLLTRKKRKAGDPIIGDPYDGQFLDDQGNDITLHTDSTTSGMTNTVPSASSGTGTAQYIGPFKVSYAAPAKGLISGVH